MARKQSWMQIEKVSMTYLCGYEQNEPLPLLLHEGG